MYTYIYIHTCIHLPTYANTLVCLWRKNLTFEFATHIELCMAGITYLQLAYVGPFVWFEL